MESDRSTDSKFGALLIAACRRDRTSRPGPALSEAMSWLSSDDERERFSAFVSQHGLVGLVARALLQTQTGMNASSRATFETLLRGMRRRTALLQVERDHVLRILAVDNINAVLLKGAGLSSSVYEVASDRDYGDIDVLVSVGDIDRAIAALAAKGYVPPGRGNINSGYLAHHFHVRVQRPDGTIVELHWGLSLPSETFALNAKAFLNESVAHAGVPQARVPRAEHALLHMVLENVRDPFMRLTRLVDIDRIIAAAPGMDWNFLEECARAGHLLPSLSLILEMSASMLGTVVPVDFLKRIRATPAVRRHLELLDVPNSLISQRSLRRASWGSLLQFWLVDDRSHLAAFTRICRGDDVEPLEWMWQGEQRERDSRPSLVQRALRVVKLVGYQLGTYVMPRRRKRAL